MKKILIKIIRFYQRYISPATPPSCRYYPTCSNYALEAVNKHGALKGGLMSTARILRCNPFVEGGVDKVPDHFTLGRNPKNRGEQHIPQYLLAVDFETKSEIKELLEKYEVHLNIFESLPASFEIMNGLADLKELSIEEIKTELSKDELDYLLEIGLIPNLESTHYQYFTLIKNEANKKYLRQVKSFDQGIDLGKDHPLIILEETGIWYTNLPKLMNEFLIERGVTPDDLENDSYHLWMVLRAIESERKTKD